MWGRVRKALKDLDPVRIENRLEKGTPDVEYVNGWIELKWKRKKPKNEDAILKLDHEYSQEQRTWAVRRHHAGGRVFVFLKIAQEWLLFEGHIAAEFLEKTSLNELRTKAIKIWYQNKLNNQELRSLLTR